MHNPVKILGVHFSYDKKGIGRLNFSWILRKLQINLDMWSARSLTLFGVLITKALGSFIPIQILKSLLDTIAGTLKKKLFNFRRHVKKEVFQFYMRKKIRIKSN